MKGDHNPFSQVEAEEPVAMPVALASQIPGNIAKATACETTSGASRSSSQTHHSRELINSSYNPELGGTVALDKIINTLIKNKNYSINGPRHWVNFYLDMKFQERRYKALVQYKNEDHEVALPFDEFCRLIADRYYHMLTGRAKINLAKIHPIGIEKLTDKKDLPHLSADQWYEILSEAEYDDYRLAKHQTASNLSKFKFFFSNLSPTNQENYRDTKIELATETPENLSHFLYFFNLESVKDFNNIRRSISSYTSVILGTKETTMAEFIDELNKLNADNRLIIICSDHPYINNEIWKYRKLNTDDFSINGFIEVISSWKKWLEIQSLTPTVVFTMPIWNKILASFQDCIMANAETLLSSMKSCKDLNDLYEHNEIFRWLVTYAQQRVTYNKNQKQPDKYRRAYNMTEDVRAENDDNDEIEATVLTPPDYQTLIETAESFAVSGNFRIAASNYCQAFNLPNQPDIDHTTLNTAIDLIKTHSVSHAYRPIFNIIDVFFRQQTYDWSRQTNHEAVLSSLITMEKHRQFFTARCAGNSKWTLHKRLSDTLIQRTNQVKRLAEDDFITHQSTLIEIQRLWKSVKELYSKSNKLYLFALLQEISCFPSHENHLECLHYLEEITASPDISNEAAIARLYFELQTQNQPDIKKCFTYKKDGRVDCFCIFKKSARIDTLRHRLFSSFQMLVMSPQNSTSDIIEQLSKSISPFQFTEEDISKIQNYFKTEQDVLQATSERTPIFQQRSTRQHRNYSRSIFTRHISEQPTAQEYTAPPSYTNAYFTEQTTEQGDNPPAYQPYA